MRNLVTLRKIDKLIPIQKADNIELAVIDGWACIVKKGEFIEGSLGFYFEIDTWIPATDARFNFLGSPKLYKGQSGWRIKTIKMRGVVSQGLMLPTSMFPELNCIVAQENYDKELKVEKWEILCGSTKIREVDPKRKFPSFIPKTDQERLQNLTHFFELHKNKEFEETLKLNGSSLTAFRVDTKLPWYKKLANKIFSDSFNESRFGVCSRNLELKQPDDFEKIFINNEEASTYNQSDFWKIAIKNELHTRLPSGFAVQGELIGPRIQANHEKTNDLELHIYDIYDINSQKYLTPSERYKMMENVLPHIPHVPIVNESIKIFQECTDFDTFQTRITGESLNPGTVSEGRVYKATDGTFSFKLISDKYLLKYEQ